MGDPTRGLYGKFKVWRTDGSDSEGGKHDGCDYFVLDLTHDPHAKAALTAYADSCEADYPLLARDLRAKFASPSVEAGIDIPDPQFDLIAHLVRQREFSERTFGPGYRTRGVLDHIRKELREIEAKPLDMSEWADVILLALDGAWRAGHSPLAIAQGIAAKQAKNEQRTWPDWRTQPLDKAIEHTKASVEAGAPRTTDDQSLSQGEGVDDASR